MTRDRHRQLTDFQKAKEKEAKIMNLSRSLKKEVNVGADVLDQVVMGDDLLSQPVELAGCVHPRGTHVVERLYSRDKAQTVGQRAGLVDRKSQVLRAGVERRLLRRDGLFNFVAPDPELHVTVRSTLQTRGRRG